MGILDFLTEGQPIQAQPYASTTESVLPDWYTNYAMDILAQQQAVAARPFALFQGPRIAEFTPEQQAAFEATKQGAFAFRPEAQQASAAATGVLGRSALGAAQPMMGQAAGMSGVQAATPGLQQGTALAQQSTNALGLQMAQPFLGAAAQTAPQTVAQYMNPYMENVVGRIGELGTRTLREQVLPGIESQMIRAGQFGGTRQAELTGRAIRDAMEGISAQQGQALAQGFGQAQSAAQADLARQAQLASTAGGLGGAQQQALLGAAGRVADIGQTYGALTQAQQQLLSELAGRTGQLYGADTEAQLRAAGQLANLAQQRQQQELTGAGALQQVGATQQAQVQRNLDLAAQDFERQFAYPQQQIGALTETLRGVAPAVPQAKLVQGYGKETDKPQEYGPSPLQQAGSAATGILSVIKALGL